MDERVPLSEAAQRARAGVAAIASATASESMKGAPAPARARKPFGTREQKLAYPQRPGYHRHWFNDEPGRIARAAEAGYTHVAGADGKNVSTIVGTARGGGSLTAYLMEIPEAWYSEDMAASEAEHKAMMAQIREGRTPGGPTGSDGAAQYVPRDRGITITEGRR